MCTGGGGRVNSMKPQECHTKNTVRECHNQMNCQRLPNRGIVRDCQNKITAREYNNQKILPGNATIKIHPESATNKFSTMECNNQNDRSVMLELTLLLGSIYGTKLVQKILSESATIRRTVRKSHNQKNI